MLATTNSTATDPELAAFLVKMKAMTTTPLQSLSNVWTYELQQRLPVAPAPAPPAVGGHSIAEAAVAVAPAGMVRVPGGKFRFAVKGIEIEGGGTSINTNPYGVDFQYPWESVPNRFHVQWMRLAPFFIDVHPVTQAEFSTYLERSGKLPTDTWHYLWNWDWTDPAKPKPHPGNATKPVTYLGLDEARAYCAALGKRLPKEEEWQFAGQGPNASSPQFPWAGGRANASLCPKQMSGNVIPGPVPVGSFSPAGDSMYGVADMLGNVWCARPQPFHRPPSPPPPSELTSSAARAGSTPTSSKTTTHGRSV